MRCFVHNSQIFHRIGHNKEPDYNQPNPKQRLCYEVWEYDNYADDHFFHNVYMSKSAAYKEVRRLKKQHVEEGGDRWDYWWILELTLQNHNELMKEMGKPYRLIG